MSEPTLADELVDSAEFRDMLRDLCLGVATLAAGTVHLVGTIQAQEVIEACGNLSRWLDEQEGSTDE